MRKSDWSSDVCSSDLGREARGLEDAHRPVPEHGAGIEDRVGELGRGARSDVETLPTVGDRGVELSHVATGVGVADLASGSERGDVGREPDGGAAVEEPLAGVDHVVLRSEWPTSELQSLM